MNGPLKESGPSMRALSNGQLSGSVTAAQRHRQMSEVAAHAAARVVYIVGTFGRCCKLIAEGEMIVHVVADRLYARPKSPSANGRICL
jgi:hypothetical protein